jgi:hypothetical protein
MYLRIFVSFLIFLCSHLLGALPILLPYVNFHRVLLQRLSLTLLWGLFENFKIREIALQTAEYNLLDRLQLHLVTARYRATAKHCLGMR